MSLKENLMVYFLNYNELHYSNNLLYRKHNAPFDITDIELAKTPVFMRNYRYGTSPDYVRKRTSNKPEMMVGLKLYAGN